MMSDDELITALRESVTGVHTATPVEQIASRGRVLRAQQRAYGAVGALAVAALTTIALVSSGHQPTAQLTAWTVAKHSDGTIYVTIHELRDPAGLQSTLRADGLPVTVNFSGPMPSKRGRAQSMYCQPYPVSKRQLFRLAHLHGDNQNAILVIRPSALPNGTGLSINDDPSGPRGSVFIYDPPGIQSRGKTVWPIVIGVVKASKQCTDS